MNLTLKATDQQTESEMQPTVAIAEEGERGSLAGYLASVAKTILKSLNPKDLLKPEPPGVEQWLQI